MCGDFKDPSCQKPDEAIEEEEEEDHFATPPMAPPIFESIRERCGAALGHIVSGLSFLEVLAARRFEEEVSEVKSREQVHLNPDIVRVTIMVQYKCMLSLRSLIF